MKKGVLKRIIALSMVFVMALGLIGIQSSGAQKEKKTGLAKLYEWYANGQETEDGIGKDVDGIERTHGTRYLGSCFWVAIGRSGSKLNTVSVSVGYRAYRVFNGVRANGFVTCGHGLKNSIDNSVYGSAGGSGRFGRIELSYFDSSCDGSFVSVLSSTTISDKTHGRGGSKVSISPTVVTVKKGDTVTQCGATSGVRSGEVAWTNDYTYLYDSTSGKNQYYSKVICTTKMSDAGDSGAPVYMYSGGKYKLVGIIVGGGEYASYILDAKTINNKLKTTPY